MVIFHSSVKLSEGISTSPGLKKSHDSRASKDKSLAIGILTSWDLTNAHATP